MSKRCVLGRCSNTPREGISVHKWPKDPKIGKIWTQFVRRTREWTGPSKHSLLCSAHFGEEAYEEQTALAKEFGYKAKLREGAIPTILPKPATKRRKSVVDDDEQQQQHGETEEMPSFSGVVTSTPVKPKERSAYHKRERARVIDDLFNQSQVSCSESTSHACVVLENEDSLESTPCEDVEKQTRKVWTRGIQVGPKYVSTATQCELLKPRPLSEDDSDDSDDDTMDDTTDPEDCDSDYEPMEYELDDSFHIQQSPSESLHKQQILLVHESSLMKLFSYCQQCQSETPASIQRRRGSMVEIKQTCLACDFNRSWTSQPQIGDMPVGNLMLSAAMLFSGACIAKTLRVFKHLNIPSICYQTYFNHQALFLQPAVKNVWLNEQDAVLDDMKLAGFNAAGDGRADSPGHSAKFGTYTLLDTDMNKVVHIELVTVTQVANSNAMEKEGLIRALRFVDEKGMKLKELTTDRHSQIRKYLREKRPSIKHSLDVWHAAKGVGKKIDKLGKKKGYEKVNNWRKSITNHLYWVASSSPNGDSDLMEAKWMSVINHIQNIHRHETPQFKRCLHQPLKGRERKKKWMIPNDLDTEKLTEILTKKALLNDVRMLSTSQQTSHLESFHGVVNHFAPKLTCFSNQGMLTRVWLAALHFNENSGKAQATTQKGEDRYKVIQPKFKKGDYSVKKILEGCTYAYVETLMKEVCNQVQKQSLRHLKVQPREQGAPTISSTFTKPDKQVAIREHKSRFSLKD